SQTLTVKVKVKENNVVKDKIDTLSVTAPSRLFHVAGEQFNLPPSCIHSVFPPAGSLGDHSDVLPHVTLERSTLPWERPANATGADENTPWLTLLVFDGEKKPTVLTGDDAKKVVLGDLPGSVSVIEVEEKHLPCASLLKKCAHARGRGRAAVPIGRQDEHGAP